MTLLLYFLDPYGYSLNAIKNVLYDSFIPRRKRVHGLETNDHGSRRANY